MKICVVTPFYAIAGVPLAQIRFARALAHRGHEVDLIIGRIDAQYRLPVISNVNVIVLGRSNVRSMLLPIMQYLRTKKPDAIFSAEDHLNTIVLIATILTGSKAKVSASSRVTPFDTYSNVPLTKRWVLKQLARATMWRANALTCVSQDMVGQYRHLFRSPPHVNVYNIVDDYWSRSQMSETLDHKWFQQHGIPVLVAAGRLAPWKGFSDLIQAVAIVANRRPVRLIILGDGPLRDSLQASIDELGLSDMIQLAGYVQNPLKYFIRADVFVLSSHVEGLPNVLVEAMMCGCTPVSTDCQTGPREVLQDGAYGYLVPVSDPSAMASSHRTSVRPPDSEGQARECCCAVRGECGH